jgi:proteasome accessory factor C
MSNSSLAPASDKLLLLLSIVPYVLDRGEVSVAEVALQFKRDESEIIRAVEMIACAGVPGDASAYSHLDLFDIDWDLFENDRRITFWNTIALDSKPRFSAREASALLAGLQYLSSHPAYAGRPDVQALTGKLRQGTGAGPSNRIVVNTPATEERLIIISAAIDAKVSVSLTYYNKRGESGPRTIDPLVVESRDAIWYVRAFCHTRQALRTFRIDHMDNVLVTDVPQGDHETLTTALPAELFEPSQDDIVVTLEFPVSALPLIADYLPRGLKAPRGSATVSVEVPFAHYGSLTMFVGAFSHVVRIAGPGTARQAVVDFANKALAHYPASSGTP